MNELESWLDVKDYEGLYQVSNLGRVRSLDRGMFVNQARYSAPRWVNRKGKILKAAAGTDGYLTVILCKLGKSKNHRVHRLVALHFVDNGDNKPEVNHLDANVLNNFSENLEWCTGEENRSHAYELGKCLGARKLTSNQVKRIRVLLRLGLHPARLARWFNTSRTNIISIRDLKTWRNI